MPYLPPKPCRVPGCPSIGVCAKHAKPKSSYRPSDAVRGTSAQRGYGHAWRKRGKSIRTLKKVDLFEISLVGEPAYESTSVALRQALAVLDGALAQAIADRRRRLEALL